MMPPGPESPASMPTRRNTNRSGAPKRMATRLDRMPASTSSAPSRIMMLTASRAAMISHPQERCYTDAAATPNGAYQSARPLARGVGGRRCACRRDGCKHRLGSLVLGHHHDRRAVLLEVLDLGLGMRAGDDRQRGTALARLRNDLSAFEGVGNGHQKAAGGRQIGSSEHIRIGGIAADQLAPGRLGGPVLAFNHQQRRSSRESRADEGA